MDYFFQDPGETRLPPEEVRLREVRVMPLPDGKRVKVWVELTPFTKRPNLEVTIISPSGKSISHANILETMLHRFEFFMHLHEAEPGEEYIIKSTLYYQSLPEPSDAPVDMPLPDPMIVDCQEVTFTLPRQNPE
jgi:hypothetical protein